MNSEKRWKILRLKVSKKRDYHNNEQTIITRHNPRFADQKTQVFVPVWFRKSWNKFTSYWGAGYWINPGSGNKNWVFAGWEAQYDFSEFITLSSELYYHTASTTEDKAITGFMIGGSLNFTKHIHLIFSGGHSIVNENLATAYFGPLHYILIQRCVNYVNIFQYYITQTISKILTFGIIWNVHS
jgi:hypothetical protein